MEAIATLALNLTACAAIIAPLVWVLRLLRSKR